MVRHAYKRLAAWLGLFAMLMVFVGPLYSQLRALESVPLAHIDLEALHCAEDDQPGQPGPPEWVHHLEQCGYCSLLAQNPAVCAVPFWPPALAVANSLSIPPPEQGHFQQPAYRPLARGPPALPA